MRLPSTSGVSERVIRVGFGVLCLLFALTALSWPLGWDQGIFTWVGDVIVHGGMPYRDAFEIKGPLVYYLTALGEALFGARPWSIRVVDIAFVAAGAWTVARATQAVAHRDAGLWAAMLFVCWYVSGSYWHTAQPDGWAGVLVMAAVTPLLAAPDRAPRLVVAGALFGAAAWIKPFYGAFAIAPATALLSLRMPWPRRIALVGAIGGGLAAVLGAGIAWFAWHGALRDLYDAYVHYNVVAYAAAAPGDRLRGLVEYLLTGTVIVVAAPVAAVGLVSIARRPAQVMLSILVVMVVLVVAAENRFYDYQWLPLLPVSSVLTVTGLATAFAARPAGGARALAWAMAAVIALHALVHPAFDVSRWAARVAGVIGPDQYLDGFNEAGNQRRMARFVDAETAPGDRVQNFGWNAGIIALADRRSSTRFGYSMPLMLGDGLPIRGRLRAEFLQCLRVHPPVLIIVGEDAPSILGRPTTVADFPEFQQYLAADYRLAATFGKLVAWRRLTPAVPEPAPAGVRCP